MAAYCTTALQTLYRPIRVAYPANSENRTAVCVRYAKAHWKKIAVAVLSGIFAGFLAGAATSRTGVALEQVVHAAPVVAATAKAVPASIAAPAISDELSRLRAENQELQTLVNTLRKHPVPARTRRAKSHRRRYGRAG